MEFSMGAALMLSSMLMLAVLERISSSNPDTGLLRGDLLPAMLCVLVISGVTVGVLMMCFGGKSDFASGTVELLAILAVVGPCFWGMRKLVMRLPGGWHHPV
jgi:hypothetical protein